MTNSAPLQLIERFLHDTIGLDFHSIGDHAIRATVNIRMKACGICDMQQYYSKLVSSADERHFLIEEVVVNETWFFRDKKPFTYLANFCRKILIDHPNKILNILSAPCSTGEEAYSIAISLLNCGISETQYHIDAIDLSTKALECANVADYAQHSFRGQQDNDILEKYLTKTTTGYRVKEHVKRNIVFKQANILEPQFCNSSGAYDVIFCRNLLIYFDAKQKLETYQHLHQLLHPQGVVILGHAEATNVPSKLFTHHGNSGEYAFCKTNTNAIKKKKPKLNTPKLANNKTKTHNTEKVVAALAPLQEQAKSSLSPSHVMDAENNFPQNTLEAATRLADAGNYRDALQACEAYLAKNNNCDKTWFLLGLIHESLADPKTSETCWRKAIYLNPQYYEALVHLALLLKHNGSTDQARQLFDRAARLQNTQPSANNQRKTSS